MGVMSNHCEIDSHNICADSLITSTLNPRTGGTTEINRHLRQSKSKGSASHGWVAQINRSGSNKRNTQCYYKGIPPKNPTHFLPPALTATPTFGISSTISTSSSSTLAFTPTVMTLAIASSSTAIITATSTLHFFFRVTHIIFLTP